MTKGVGRATPFVHMNRAHGNGSRLLPQYVCTEYFNV